MDEEIASALSRLLLASGGPDKAREYLESFINQGGSSDLTNISTPSSGSVDLQRSPAAEPLSPIFEPTTNLWEDCPGRSLPSPKVASPCRKAQSYEKRSSNSKHRTAVVHRLTDGPLIFGGDEAPPWPTPSTPSTQRRPHRTMSALSDSPAYSGRSIQSPAPTISTMSQTSDQPLSARDPPLTAYDFPLTARNPPLTPRRESRNVGRNRYGNAPASPSPVSSPILAGEDRPRTLGIHPNLASIEPSHSSLSELEFETVMSKIRADPDYLGELPFIRLANPQCEIKTVVHAPPKHGSGGKWYKVSRGRTVGIFTSWGPAAKATQGVSMAIHESYVTRGEAIVAYQVCLLRGEVELVN